MKKLQTILSITCILVITYTLQGQNFQIDSLSKLILEEEISEKDLSAIYNQLSYEYRNVSPDSQLVFASRAKEIAERNSDTEQIAAAYKNIGLNHSNRADFDKALMYYDTSLTFAKKADSRLLEGELYNNLGIVYWNLGEYPEAITYYLKSLELKREEGDQRGIGMTMNNLGLVFQWVGEYDSALSYYIKSLAIAESSEDLKNMSSTYINIGIVMTSIKNYDNAKKYLHKAFLIKREISDVQGQAVAYEYLGLVAFEIKDFTEALNIYSKSLELYKQMQDKSGVASIHNKIGTIFLNIGAYDTALASFNQSLKINNVIGDKHITATILKNIALAHQKLDNMPKAIEFASQSQELAMRLGLKKESADALNLLHQFYSDQGDKARAYDALKLNFLYQDSILNEQIVREIQRTEAKYTTEQLHKTNELLVQENKLSESELQKSNLQIQKQNTILLALAVCLGFSVLSSIMWYRYNKAKRSTIITLEKLNAEINYQKEQIAQQAKELQKANLEIKEMNDSLEKKIENRTQHIELQNRKLKEYAFSNSHIVRAPLANILGLADLFISNQLSKSEIEQLSEKIHESAQSLDNVLKELNKELEKEY